MKNYIAGGVPLAIAVIGSVWVGNHTDSEAFDSGLIGKFADVSALSFVQQQLIAEHCPLGLPDEDNILIRPGYISSYDAANRVPQWVSYHIQPDYRNTPKREGQFAKFHPDPQINDPVKHSDYTHSGYSRGHIFPYAVSGGDRDGDGKNSAQGDVHEHQTIFTANYLSNITPQIHDGFNGNSGLWYNLERWVQDVLIDEAKQKIWVIAGPVYTLEYPKELVRIRDTGLLKTGIRIPSMYFKILYFEVENEPVVLAFLFPHLKRKRDNLTDYLVSVDYIEKLTGLDFFRNSVLGEDFESFHTRESLELLPAEWIKKPLRH